MGGRVVYKTLEDPWTGSEDDKFILLSYLEQLRKDSTLLSSEAVLPDLIDELAPVSVWPRGVGAGRDWWLPGRHRSSAAALCWGEDSSHWGSGAPSWPSFIFSIDFPHSVVCHCFFLHLRLVGRPVLQQLVGMLWDGVSFALLMAGLLLFFWKRSVLLWRECIFSIGRWKNVYTFSTPFPFFFLSITSLFYICWLTHSHWLPFQTTEPDTHVVQCAGVQASQELIVPGLVHLNAPFPFHWIDEGDTG